jgi:hypothetical protein
MFWDREGLSVFDTVFVWFWNREPVAFKLLECLLSQRLVHVILNAVKDLIIEIMTPKPARVFYHSKDFLMTGSPFG